VLIAGGRLVDPTHGIDAGRDLRLRDGIVVEVGEHLIADTGEETLDATGAVVAPGFIDMHVHLRDPGYPEKETIATGTLAAARGGFTAVACMPNTNPALDTPDIITSLSKGAHVRVYPIAAITRGRRGQELLDYAALAAAGAVAFSDDGNTVMDPRVLREAALAARATPGVFISHALDDRLHGDAVMHEGSVSRALGLPGSPGLAEDIIVARDLLVARETGKAWHIAHVSTATSLQLIRAARAAGMSLTCEVTPHHLFFSDEAVRKLGTDAKVNPPLRTEDDVAALRQGVREGIVDALASDHAPHTAAEKSGDMHTASVGFSGLEIAVGAYALALPGLPLSRFVELLSTNPARILGVPGGTLELGAPADVTIFADRDWRVDPTLFASKGRSTPFSGQVLPRAIVATIVGGRLAFHAKAVSPR
jgi:dihydroorotase